MLRIGTIMVAQLVRGWVPLTSNIRLHTELPLLGKPQRGA